MLEIRRTTTATPAEVFAVLADGWLFPNWVVGAARMREVDDTWPAVDSKLHHSFGLWPLMVDDTTSVLRNEAPHLLILQARGWPAGEATVELRIAAWGEGSMITIREDATRGPGVLVPRLFRQVPIGLRNRETLRRLVFIAEGRK